MNANQLQTVSSYFATSPKGVTEELYFSAYHVHELDGTVLRVMTQHGKHHDEPITGWELILDLTDGKSHYRNRDGRIYDCF